MNLFQIVALPTLLLLALSELRGCYRGTSPRWLCIGRLVLWLVACALIAQPSLTSYLAQLLGIGRGADLVMYLYMLFTPLVWFQLQKGQLSLERRVVTLARAEALRTASQGDSVGNLS